MLLMLVMLLMICQGCKTKPVYVYPNIPIKKIPEAPIVPKWYFEPIDKDTAKGSTEDIKAIATYIKAMQTYTTKLILCLKYYEGELLYLEASTNSQ